MNKIIVVFGLCVFCAVSSFARGQIIKQVVEKGVLERGVTKAVFVQKQSLSAVVNGYLHTTAVTHFTLPTGEEMRAVRFSRNIDLKKEQFSVLKGSLAVVNPEGKITLYGPEEELPAEIKAGLDAAFEREFPGFMEAFTPAEETVAAASKPWTGTLSYEDQTALAIDINAYYEGNAEEVVWDRIGKQECKIYRIPSGDIYYAGKNKYLRPNEDLIIFYPAQNRGQIVFDGLKNETWRMFFKPLP